MAKFQYTFPPRAAPKASFDVNGAPIFLEAFRGKPILINFWATWCAPCLKELPSLDALQGRFDVNEFEVVAIAADPRGPETAREFLDRLEIERLELYSDPTLRFAAAAGSAEVLPVSILYDADGREIGRLIGEADWNSAEAVRLIRSTLR